MKLIPVMLKLLFSSLITTFFFLECKCDITPLQLRRVVISGTLTVSNTEELTFFIKPLSNRKLFDQSKCRGYDCEFTTTLVKRGNTDVINFKIAVNHVSPEICCSIRACMTKQNYAIQMPRRVINSILCPHNYQWSYYPQFIEYSLDTSLYTWFMEESHYNDMKINGTAFLLVPQSQEPIPIFADVIHIGTVQCRYHVNGPSVQMETIESTNKNGIKSIRYKYDLRVNNEATFNLFFSCSTTFNHHVDNLLEYETVTKRLTVLVKRDPSIIIAESTTFSTEDVTQQVKLDVLSSKLISTVSVRTAYTGQGTPTVITALPQQSIVHHYYIAFNGIKPSMTGQYNVSIEMTDGTIVWSIFNISVSQMPRVEITPKVINVGLYQSARFDCVAYGIDIRGIEWTREGFPLENIKKEKYLSAIDNIAGLQVNFTSPRYTDGGEYGCRVWTSHPQHVVVAYAELYVFYPGSPNIDPSYEVINDTTHPNGTFYVPNDWEIDDDGGDSNIAGVNPIVFGIITALALFGFIMLIVTLSLIRWGIDSWRYKIRRKKNSLENKRLKDVIDKIKNKTGDISSSSSSSSESDSDKEVAHKLSSSSSEDSTVLLLHSEDNDSEISYRVIHSDSDSIKTNSVSKAHSKGSDSDSKMSGDSESHKSGSHKSGDSSSNVSGAHGDSDCNKSGDTDSNKSGDTDCNKSGDTDSNKSGVSGAHGKGSDSESKRSSVHSVSGDSDISDIKVHSGGDSESDLSVASVNSESSDYSH